MYDIFPIKMVEQSGTSDTSTTISEEQSISLDTSTADIIIAQEPESVNSDSQNSPRDSDERLDKLLEELLPDLILYIESKKNQ